MTLRGATALLEVLALPNAAALEQGTSSSNTCISSGELEGSGASLGLKPVTAGACSADKSGVSWPALPQGARRPLWLRLEWNRISLDGLVQVGARHA